VKGVPAQRLLDHVIGGLDGHLPGNVRTIRTRVGARGGLQVWPVPREAPDDYGFWETAPREGELGRIEQRGTWLPWGFGSWLPLPRRARIRADAVGALETVREAVRNLDESWPSADATARAKVEGDEVVVWFETAVAASLPPPVRLPRAAFE
jgi:hypothetical protein